MGIPGIGSYLLQLALTWLDAVTPMETLPSLTGGDFEAKAGVHETGVEHADGDVFELMRLSSDERCLEVDLGERPVSAVKRRVAEVVHVRRARRLRAALCPRRTAAVTTAYPTNTSHRMSKYMYTVSKKTSTFIFPITLSNIN